MKAPLKASLVAVAVIQTVVLGFVVAGRVADQAPAAEETTTMDVKWAIKSKVLNNTYMDEHACAVSRPVLFDSDEAARLVRAEIEPGRWKLVEVQLTAGAEHDGDSDQVIKWAGQ